MGTMLAVGLPMPGYVPRAEGAILQANYLGSLAIVIAFENVKDVEVERFSSGKVRVGLRRAGDHTFFLIFAIDNFLPWGDCPYAVGMARDARYPEDRKPEEGFAFTTILLERSTGVIRAMRMGSVTPRFSKMFEALIDEQAANLATFSMEKHQAEIAVSYAKYPTPADMIRDASNRESIGQPFPKADPVPNL